MAIGLIKGSTIVGLIEEVTEGTYVAPAAATDFTQILKDGFSMTPSKELVERNLLSTSIGKVTPRVGKKSVAVEMPVEFRASGVEGGQPDFHILLKNLFGSTRTITAQNTSKAAGNTAQVLQIEDADIADYTVGDIVVVLESGDYIVSPITAVDSTGGAANITLLRTRAAGAFSGSVVISKSQMYLPANTGHTAMSISSYWANEIRESAIGCKVASMSLNNFSTGAIGDFGFSLEGLSFDQIDGVSPFSSPTYDIGLPPLILSSCIYQDGTEIKMNELSMSFENTISFLESTCSADGRISSRVSSRAISGSIAPYKDDTSVSQFTNFDNNTEYSLFFYSANPSTTSGEFDLGSVVGIYLPKCITTELAVADVDETLTDAISFSATRGAAGTTEEIYMGLI